VKLLFDENLSPNLVIRLADRFPDSCHVREVGLQAADDQGVREYAKSYDLVIVSKDGDIHQRSFLFGAPPKVVWVRVGNWHNEALRIFNEDQFASFLSLS